MGHDEQPIQRLKQAFFISTLMNAATSFLGLVAAMFLFPFVFLAGAFLFARFAATFLIKGLSGRFEAAAGLCAVAAAIFWAGWGFSGENVLATWVLYASLVPAFLATFLFEWVLANHLAGYKAGSERSPRKTFPWVLTANVLSYLGLAALMFGLGMGPRENPMLSRDYVHMKIRTAIERDDIDRAREWIATYDEYYGMTHRWSLDIARRLMRKGYLEDARRLVDQVEANRETIESNDPHDGTLDTEELRKELERLEQKASQDTPDPAT